MLILTLDGREGRPHPAPPPSVPVSVSRHPPPLLAVLHVLFATAAGRIVLAAVLLLLLCIFSATMRKIVAPFWRLLTGGLVLVTPGPWDASFDRAAPERPVNRANYRGERYPRTWWAKIPGYQRMTYRWLAAGYGYLLWHWPVPVLALTFAVGVGIAGRKAWHVVQDMVFQRTAGVFIAGVVATLGQHGENAPDPATFIAFPRLRLVWLPIAAPPAVTRAARRIWVIGPRLERVLGHLGIPAIRIPLHEDEAQVLIHLDAALTDERRVQELARLGAARLEEGPWEHEHHQKELTLEFKHPKRPPAQCWYDAVATLYAIDNVPIGQKAGGAWATLPLKALTPHGVMSATTGWCKTTTANVYVAHTAGHGGKVFINDPKRVGYTLFNGLEYVIIRTTADGWADTVAAFLDEMESRYELIEAYPEIKENPELYFQPWFLLNDERGSYIADLKDWWKSRPEAKTDKGLPLPLRQEKKILWQGRAAAMYVVDLCQQANLSVFLDSDGRDQRMWRIASGPQTRSSWFMLFSGVAKKSISKKGRAYLGIGVDDVEEITLARISDEDARALAENGASIAEQENELRNQRLRELIARSEPAALVPATDRTPSAEIPESTPGSDEDTRVSNPGTVPAGSGYPNVVPIDRKTGQANDEEATPPGPGENTSGNLIIGNKEAAAFLQMTEAAFLSARKNRPIRGERREKTRYGEQPAWMPLDLKEWRSQAPRAGAS